MSMAFLGIQIDAVYHTSIVIDGKEWYYGAGIQSSLPGATHHGKPMEIIPLGMTSLPEEVIVEYIDSMRSTYTMESYDLFMHNCNNFTADLSMFLTGRGIPDKIKNLPQEVLKTPFGQMMRPALEAQLRPITQAPTPAAAPPPRPTAVQNTPIKTVRSVQEFENLIKTSPAVAAFFTSATCPPCKLAEPHFLSLAEQNPRATFIKIDVGIQQDIGSHYRISATPTFITWSKGAQLSTWRGGLRGDMETEISLMINDAFPPHRHMKIPIHNVMAETMIASRNPTIFNKVPPIDKVKPRLGPVAEDPNVASLISFLQHRALEGSKNAPVPNEPTWAKFLCTAFTELPVDVLFPLVDLFRASLADSRVSGWFAEEADHKTIRAMIEYSLRPETPYNIQLVTTQAVVNLFTSPLWAGHLCQEPILSLVVSMITTFLLDREHVALRVAASVVAFMMATHVQKERSTASKEVIGDEKLVEMAIGFVEAIKEEQKSEEVVKALVVALALVIYCVPAGSEVEDVMEGVEAKGVLEEKIKGGLKVEKALLKEVAELVGA
jgi:thiol-disulfide isomerase/thioredoxin